MKGAIEILVPGLATTVQDLGRVGWLRVGVPPSGALDPLSHALANALVGHVPAAPALEIRYLGPSLRCLGAPQRVALVGAEVAMRVERAEGGEAETIGAWRTATLQPGDVLRVGPLKGSSTATLALSPGPLVEPVLSSRSAFLRGGFGGGFGRTLRAGDRLPAAPGGPTPLPPGLQSENGAVWIPPESRPPTPAPDAEGVWTVRVMLGPQDDHFTPAGLETFLGAVWTVTQEADRMGIRLDGPTLEHAPAKGFNIVSDGIVTGALQVPGTGRPILLLADRGTAGGYPKIAVAISADLPLVGRLGPGAKIRFEAVDEDAALAACRAQHLAIEAARAAIAPFHEPGVINEEALRRSNLITARVED